MEKQIKLIKETDAGIDGSYLGTFAHNEALEPERALLLAVLEDAIHCFHKYSTARSRFGRNRFAEAERWIMQNREDWVFGFENICEVFGLKPEYMRRGLAQWKLQAGDREISPRYRQFRKRAA
jgi:hypothetical protein